MRTTRSTHVVIPVKSFDRAKARLAPALDPAERSHLARTLATGVVEAAAGLPVWIVCDDEAVVNWANDLGASVCLRPGIGLNAAVQAAVDERFDDGAARTIVVHSDLPLVTTLKCLAVTNNDMLIAPDRHGTGTNAISTPTPSFRFAFGKNSFRRHVDEARRCALQLRVISDDTFAWDVDEPNDLTALERAGRFQVRPARPV